MAPRNYYVAYNLATVGKVTGYAVGLTCLDPYYGNKLKHDQLLHDTLSGIFRERCRDSPKKIETFLRDPKQQYILYKLVLKKPSLRKILPNETPLSLLWIAVLNSYQKTAELLVRSGACVNKPCETKLDKYVNETTRLVHLLPRMFPCSWNEQFLALIVEHGADLLAQDGTGQTALHWAISSGRVELLEMLLEKAAGAVNIVDTAGETPLLAALDSSKVDELLPILLKHGADVKARHGQTHMNVLHSLASVPNTERIDLARLFIEKGVSLDDKEQLHMYQPIHLAAFRGKNEMVKLFLDCGANVNAKALEDVSPLYLAARCKNPAVLMTLLERGADIDSKTRADNHTSGRTALHNTFFNSWEISEKNARILLSAGADVCVEDHIGNTPFSLINMPDIRMTNPNVRLMIRVLAQKKAQDPSIELKDERIIVKFPTLWNFYQECVAEIRQAKSTRFIERCTFFELLTECQCHVGLLMWDIEFGNNFGRFNFNVFTKYVEDILGAFGRAKAYYQNMVEHQDVLNEAIHSKLPYALLRKVTKALRSAFVVCLSYASQLRKAIARGAIFAWTCELKFERLQVAHYRERIITQVVQKVVL